MFASVRHKLMFRSSKATRQAAAPNNDDNEKNTTTTITTTTTKSSLPSKKISHKLRTHFTLTQAGSSAKPKESKQQKRPLDMMTEASAETSFESAMSSLDAVVHDIDDDRSKRTDRRAASNISSCKSIANGWFYPETNLIIICGQSTNQSSHHNAHAKALELVKMEEWWRPLPLECPFSSGVGSISAESLLDRLEVTNFGVTENVRGMLIECHDSSSYYDNPNHLKFLEEGGAFYSFTCRTWMTPYERDMVKTMANMSGFADETRDNFVPGFDINDPNDLKRYTFVLQKSAYLLPGVHLSVITPELMSGTEYHKQCQPGGTKIWEQREKNTFRFTKPIIPRVYNMTIQFTVSKIKRVDLDALSKLMGIRVDHGILMERTKRSRPPKTDATAKAKSILCYTAIPGGVLVTHSTVILNTSIPTVLAKVVDTFGSMGLRETCETAERTRAHILDVIAKSGSRMG